MRNRPPMAEVVRKEMLVLTKWSLTLGGGFVKTMPTKQDYIALEMQLAELGPIHMFERMQFFVQQNTMLSFYPSHYEEANPSWYINGDSCVEWIRFEIRIIFWPDSKTYSYTFTFEEAWIYYDEEKKNLLVGF